MSNDVSHQNNRIHVNQDGYHHETIGGQQNRETQQQRLQTIASLWENSSSESSQASDQNQDEKKNDEPMNPGGMSVYVDKNSPFYSKNVFPSRSNNGSYHDKKGYTQEERHQEPSQPREKQSFRQRRPQDEEAEHQRRLSNQQAQNSNYFQNQRQLQQQRQRVLHQLQTSPQPPPTHTPAYSIPSTVAKQQSSRLSSASLPPRGGVRSAHPQLRMRGDRPSNAPTTTPHNYSRNEEVEVIGVDKVDLGAHPSKRRSCVGGYGGNNEQYYDAGCEPLASMKPAPRMPIPSPHSPSPTSVSSSSSISSTSSMSSNNGGRRRRRRRRKRKNRNHFSTVSGSPFVLPQSNNNDNNGSSCNGGGDFVYDPSPGVDKHTSLAEPSLTDACQKPFALPSVRTRRKENLNAGPHKQPQLFPLDEIVIQAQANKRKNSTSDANFKLSNKTVESGGNNEKSGVGGKGNDISHHGLNNVQGNDYGDESVEDGDSSNARSSSTAGTASTNAEFGGDYIDAIDLKNMKAAIASVSSGRGSGHGNGVGRTASSAAASVATATSGSDYKYNYPMHVDVLDSDESSMLSSSSSSSSRPSRAKTTAESPAGTTTAASGGNVHLRTKLESSNSPRIISSTMARARTKNPTAVPTGTVSTSLLLSRTSSPPTCYHQSQPCTEPTTAISGFQRYRQRTMKSAEPLPQQQPHNRASDRASAFKQIDDGPSSSSSSSSSSYQEMPSPSTANNVGRRQCLTPPPETAASSSSSSSSTKQKEPHFVPPVYGRSLSFDVPATSSTFYSSQTSLSTTRAFVPPQVRRAASFDVPQSSRDFQIERGRYQLGKSREVALLDMHPTNISSSRLIDNLRQGNHVLDANHKADRTECVTSQDPPSTSGIGDQPDPLDQGGPTPQENQNSFRKYAHYSVSVNRDELDRATEIQPCSFARPHMRALYFCWWSLFISYFCWFAITPLLPEVQESLGLSSEEIWTSTIASMLMGTLLQIPLGSLANFYGARVPMALLLCIVAIPAACIGLVETANGLSLVRMFIGSFGASFVLTQFWASQMFSRRIVGTASSLVGGWVESGVAQLVMGSGLFPLLKRHFGSEEKAWRNALALPPMIAFITGVGVYFFTDDTPRGNYADLKRAGSMSSDVSVKRSFHMGAANVNTWLLFAQYACIFGVSVTIVNAAPLYFHDEFGQSTETAAALSSIYGWMAISARIVGGCTSDRVNRSWGLRGRLWLQTILLLGEGTCCIMLANAKSLVGAIVLLGLTSVFEHAASASTFGIVPYIDPPTTGSIAGLVGAGGGFGGVGFSLGFRQLGSERAFQIMGLAVCASSLLSALVRIRGHGRLLCSAHVANNWYFICPKLDDEAADANQRGDHNRNNRDDDDSTLAASVAVQPTGHHMRRSISAAERGLGKQNLSGRMRGGSDDETQSISSHASSMTFKSNVSDWWGQGGGRVDHSGDVDPIVSVPDSLQQGQQVLSNSLETYAAERRARPQRGPGWRCPNNHNRYQVGTIYGRLDSPQDMRTFLGERNLSTHRQRHCRECRVKIATRRKAKRNGVIPTPQDPVYVCLECEQVFVCSVCWRGHTSGVPDWAHVVQDLFIK